MVLAKAAAEKGLDPKRLSMSTAWVVLKSYEAKAPRVQGEAEAHWRQALFMQLCRGKLEEPKGRSCPRVVKKSLSKFPNKARWKGPLSSYPGYKAELKCRKPLPENAIP